MTYLKKKDDKTVLLSGFEHVNDTLYVYVSPIDGKLIFNTQNRNSPHITAFSVMNSEINSKELIDMIEKVEGFEKMMLYNERDGSYYISPLKITDVK